MNKLKYLLLTIIILSALLLGACNMPTGDGAEDAAATTIAETAAAVFTHAAETAAVTGVPSATTAPEASAVPTITTIASPTKPPPTATTKPIPCNRGSFVKDVTIPDGSEIAAGASFTKTWRIKNNGSCTWGTNYVVLFDSGEQMGAPATAPIGGSVAPGATIDISVNLTAPAAPGTYQGNFKFRSHDNIVFGINTDAQGPFWVKIVVPNPVATATPTATATTVPVHSSGSADIASSFYGNLDDGSDDFWYHAAVGGDFIEPQNGATMVTWGATAPSKAQCEGAALSSAAITLDNSLINQYLCHKTDQGRFGNFKVTAYDGSTLSISYTTWE